MPLILPPVADQQSSSLDLERVVDVVGILTDTLQGYRSKAYFSELWKGRKENSTEALSQSLKPVLDCLTRL